MTPSLASNVTNSSNSPVVITTADGTSMTESASNNNSIASSILNVLVPMKFAQKTSYSSSRRTKVAVLEHDDSNSHTDISVFDHHLTYSQLPKVAVDEITRVEIMKQLSQLTQDQESIVMYASLIGLEFSEKLLKHIMPSSLMPAYSSALETLLQRNMISLVVDPNEVIYVFDDVVVHRVIADLATSEQAAPVHYQIAQYIEHNYERNLQPHYARLAHHYIQSLHERSLAFKYNLKAAEYCMARSNFQEGYQFLQLAHALAIGREELRMLLIVCSYALTELNQSIFGDDEHFRDIQVKIMLLQNSVKLAFKVIRIKSKGSQRSQRLTWTLDYAMMQEDETMTYKFMSFRRSNHSGKAYSKENGFCCIQ